MSKCCVSCPVRKFDKFLTVSRRVSVPSVVAPGVPDRSIHQPACIAAEDHFTWRPFGASSAASAASAATPGQNVQIKQKEKK